MAGRSSLGRLPSWSKICIKGELRPRWATRHCSERRFILRSLQSMQGVFFYLIELVKHHPPPENKKLPSQQGREEFPRYHPS